MPKLTVGQFGVTAGELSPFLWARTDLQRYQQAAKKLENVTPLVFGGMLKRYGTRMIAPIKNESQGARLVPFVINRSKAYMLEFGDGYMRVFDGDGNRVPDYEIATTYSFSMIWDVDYIQGADAMFMAHLSQPIQRLKNFAANSWYIGTPPFTALPFDEIGLYPNVGLVLDSVNVGSHTVVADGDVFYPSDPGRAITLDAGIAVVTSVTDARHASVMINSPFSSASLAAGTWNLDASPMCGLRIGTVVDEGVFTTIQLDQPGFRGDEAGQYIRANGGLFKIEYITSNIDAGVTTLATPTAAGANADAPALAWSLNASVWSAHYGYPRTVSLHEQRLIAAGSMQYPQTVWGSVVGEKLNFNSGTTLDSDAFSFTIESDEVNPIEYVASGRDLLALTDGGPFSLKGGVEKPITPTNVQIDRQGPIGALNVRPVNVGKEIMFVERAGRKIRAMAYQYTIDGYVAPDITVLAEHITQTGVCDMAFQQAPYQIIWCVRNDGVLISCTIDRDQDVIAWARHSTDGFFESIATIPGAQGDDLWAIVRRTVNGQTRRFVERFESSWLPYPSSAKDWGFMLDCAVSYSLTVPQATFTGLDHLEGKQVRAVADGASLGFFVVTGGAIILPRTAYTVLVGLPYTVTIEQLRPEVQTGTGTAQTSAMRTNSVTMRVHETLGILLNGKVAAAKRFGGHLLDVVQAPVTGDVDLTELGWDNGDSPEVITQEEPLPFHLLGIFKSLTSNQR